MITNMRTLRLREWREHRGLSIRRLAEKAGVAFPSVYRIEAGKMSPTVAMLEKLAKALGIHTRDLFPEKEERARRGATGKRAGSLSGRKGRASGGSATVTSTAGSTARRSAPRDWRNRSTESARRPSARGGSSRSI